MLLDAFGEWLGEDEHSSSLSIKLNELAFKNHIVLLIVRCGSEQIPF